MPNQPLSDALIAELTGRLGVRFDDLDALRLALTHRSLVNEAELSGTDCNERLEFLGDAALGLVAARFLYERYPDRAEGQLSHARASLVNLGTLARFARQIDLGRYLQLGHGEDLSGGRSRTSVLGRGFEAVLGAIYLDQGLHALSGFLNPFLERELASYGWRGPERDFKSRLQELLQAQHGVTPAYELCDQQGPDHAKQFRMAVTADGETLGDGRGSSKQRAEQAAARSALRRLQAVASKDSRDVSKTD